MILSLVLSILIGISIPLSQKDFKLEQELKYKSDYFILDQLGFLYLVNGTELQKVDLKTHQKKNFSNISSGKIYSIDVTDPFRTLLFYKDFNKLEWLDKNLSQIASPISLDQLGFYQVEAVCQSVNGGFWLFDQSLYQIVYIDKNLNVANKSTQFAEMIDQNSDLKQVYMLEKNDYIYLGINGNNILLFDTYGTYIKTFPINYNREFQVNNGTIIYSNNNELFVYDTKDYTESKMELPRQDFDQIKVGNRRVFIKIKEKIFIYQVSNL